MTGCWTLLATTRRFAVCEAVEGLLRNDKGRRMISAADRRWVIKRFACQPMLQFYKSLLRNRSGLVFRPQQPMEPAAGQC